jgi:hypothetical protein
MRKTLTNDVVGSSAADWALALIIRRLDICHFGARARWKAWRVHLLIIWFV